MADERFVQPQIQELQRAQKALDYAVTFAHRWPQEEFNKLLRSLAQRVEDAARAVELACLSKD
jgi:hypothetical protein